MHTLCVGGAEVLAAQIARKLRGSYRFIFFCLDEMGSLGKRLQEEGFPVHVIGRREGIDLRCPARLAALCRKEKVEILQAHQYGPFFYAMMARLVSPRMRILFTEHGRHFPDFPRRKRIFVNRLLLSRRDRVVSVGQGVREALIRNEGLSPSRIDVIYNGIDLNRFHNRSGERATVRRELGIGDTDFVVLQVARLDYLKDHATAIRAFRRVVREVANAHLLLAGEGPELDTIRRHVSEAPEDVASRVHFLGLRSDVPRLLSAADVFLLTSISEGIPLTLIEAMAAQLPTVSTDVGGIAEVVVDRVTGFLAPAKDDDCLALGLVTLARNPELCRRFGLAGRRRAEQVFSEEQMLAGYRRTYEDMLR